MALNTSPRLFDSMGLFSKAKAAEEAEGALPAEEPGYKLHPEAYVSEEERNEIAQRLRAVHLFPGSVGEYERFIGSPAEILDTRTRDKSFYLSRIVYNFVDPGEEQVWDAGERGLLRAENTAVARKLLEQGLEALVRVNYLVAPHMAGSTKPASELEEIYFGLPVRRKREKTTSRVLEGGDEPVGPHSPS